MHVLSAIHQYLAVNLWSKGGFCQRRSPSTTYFCLALDPPLGISGRNHYKNGSITSKVFEALSDSFLSCLGSTQGGSDSGSRADLIKSPNTCAGHENFIPTKFHKHPSSSSEVKADYVCSHVLVHPPSFT